MPKHYKKIYKQQSEKKEKYQNLNQTKLSEIGRSVVVDGSTCGFSPNATTKS